MDLNQIIYNHISDGLVGNGNRSSIRTDKLHINIFKYIKNQIIDFDKKYNVVYEAPIPCAYGNKFKIDILIEDKQGNMVACILLKAFISSVQKNRANNANTTQGEIFRIRGLVGRENVKIWFISLIANKIPTYKSEGTLIGIENIETAYVDFSKIETRPNIYHSTVKYDLLNVDYYTKTNFKNTLRLDSIKNITKNTLIDNAKNIF